MKMIAPQKSPEQVKDSFVAQGITVTHWAEQNGFKAAQVYDVLNGRNKARHGEGHRIAVKLGLKRSA